MSFSHFSPAKTKIFMIVFDRRRLFAGCAPDAVSLNEQLNDEISLFLGQVHFTQGESVSFGVGPLALRAPEAPESVSVTSKPLA